MAEASEETLIRWAFQLGEVVTVTWDKAGQPYVVVSREVCEGLFHRPAYVYGVVLIGEDVHNPVSIHRVKASGVLPYKEGR